MDAMALSLIARCDRLRGVSARLHTTVSSRRWCRHRRTARWHPGLDMVHETSPTNSSAPR